jgi:thioredoxin-related protein
LLRVILLALMFFAVNVAGSARAAELVMFLASNCEWCEVWDKEVGTVFAKTAEAKRAPLRRIDIFDPRPKDLDQVKGIHFTPTFVLMEKGTEVGRITGYPGESFFWELLNGLIAKLPAKGANACAVPGQQGRGGKLC